MDICRLPAAIFGEHVFGHPASNIMNGGKVHGLMAEGTIAF
jgi:hypothetical protein